MLVTMGLAHHMRATAGTAVTDGAVDGPVAWEAGATDGTRRHMARSWGHDQRALTTMVRIRLITMALVVITPAAIRRLITADIIRGMAAIITAAIDWFASSGSTL